jgi:hypothetical protein
MWIDEDNVIPFSLQVYGDKVAGAILISGDAHNCNVPVLLQQP